MVDQTFNKTESIFTYTETNSTFEIQGTDEANSVHGLTQDCAWFNEPYDIGIDTFNQIDQRTSDFIILDLNPKMGHWSDDLEKDPRTLIIHSTFRDNPFCPEEPRRKILGYQSVKFSEVVTGKLMSEQEAKEYDIITNEKEFSQKQINELARCIENERKNSANDFNWCVYGLGLKAERPNRIFRWNEIPDDFFDKIDSEIYYASDWGKVHPWGVLAAKYYDGVLYLKEINYLSENQIREKLTATEQAQIQKDEETGLVLWYWNKFAISRNSTIICDPNRTSKILALRALGYDYAIAAHKPPGSILDGISLLDSIRVLYTSSSRNLDYEQENYSNKVDRYGVVLEEPEDKFNHLIDGARYIAEYLHREGIILDM